MVFIVIFFLLVLALVVEGAISQTMLDLTEVPVESTDIPKAFDGFRILQLSDLHGTTFGRDNARLLHAIREARPDMIVLAGDMINVSGRSRKLFYALASKLGHEFPVYYTYGNHEFYLTPEALERHTERVLETGIQLLNNDHVVIRKDNERIDLFGLSFGLPFYRRITDAATRHATFEPSQMDELMGARPDHYAILLAHNPAYFDTYAAWGANLTLSGHIHGGLVRLPLVGGVLSPERRFFPQYDAGLFRKGTHLMYVNRGLGAGKIGFRLFNLPEITVFTFYHAQQSSNRALVHRRGMWIPHQKLN